MKCYEEKESMYRDKELQRVHREGSLKRCCLDRTLKEMKCMNLWWKSDLGGGRTKRWENVLGIQATPKMWGNCKVRVSSFSSVAQSCPSLWNPLDCSMPGFPVHHQLSEPTQNSCPLSWWCHPTISSSVVPFSSHLQSFPASGSFPMSRFFTSGGQSIGVSASASVLPMIIQDWFSLGLTGLISLQSEGLSRVFSNTTVQKHQFFSSQLSL